jgi:hypothetical protein
MLAPSGGSHKFAYDWPGGELLGSPIFADTRAILFWAGRSHTWEAAHRQVVTHTHKGALWGERWASGCGRRAVLQILRYRRGVCGAPGARAVSLAAPDTEIPKRGVHSAPGMRRVSLARRGTRARRGTNWRPRGRIPEEKPGAKEVRQGGGGGGRVTEQQTAIGS